ncbi:DNA internalization-related competence protein ComEC/Rec2 [Deinococcus cavernae]|uniref:DNA internalization-related competence protein ComEC/Rec2 n=1 Tax=Deinococcus cavernae TaxID=2320857 RepID=A0A418VAI3_9DEIO|nr:DNA internalization-related competence protein ComEC/Rec2 [Deinococcus cavernae]RJF73141.1 DNA internalization-related competence protein ComEC/Rec2 [Deinococcus cavernae]
MTASPTRAAPRPAALAWPLPTALGVIGGILLALHLPWGGALILLAAAYFLSIRDLRPLMLAAAGALAGYTSASVTQSRPDPMTPWLGAQVTLKGYWDGQFLNLEDPRARVALAPKPPRPPGQLTVSGRLERPSPQRTPGGFDQAAWLRAQGGLFTPAPGSVLGAARVRAYTPAAGLQGWFRRGLSAGLSERHAALMQAIELGDRSDLGREEFAGGYSVRDAFNRAGLAHLMALSGQNVALLTGVIILLLSGLNLRPPARYLIPAFLLIPYLFLLVGMSPSIARAVLMGFVALIGLAVGRGRSDPLATIALAALVCLLIYPLWLLDIGFQLSFLAVLGLTLSGRLAERLPARWPRVLRLALSATILAELATLPVIASTFGQLPLVGLPANLLAEVVMAALVPLGFLAGLLGPAGGLVNWLVGPLASLLLALAEGFGRAPVLPWGHLGPGGFAAYAVAAAAGVLWLLGRARGKVALAAALGCAVLSALPPMLRPVREITYLDVGQGDSTLVRLRGLTMLVDGGGSVGSDFDVGTRTVIPTLRSLGVRKIDVLVATHADTDHIEGLTGVLNSLRVGEVWIGQPKRGDPVLNRVLQAAQAQRVPVRQVSRGDRFSVDGVTFTVLWPQRNMFSTADNDNSIVLTLESGAWRTALLGDLPDPAENFLGLGNLDLLKAAHHGSRYSTSAEFLRQTTPRNAIISVGRNTYGHPHPDVLKRLREAGVNVWRTDEQGTIHWPIP